MTHELLSALRSGVTSTEYFRLLQNYGYWTHTTGCKGWRHGSSDVPTPVITDDTALEIDKAVGCLKSRRPNLYLLFGLYYIKQRDLTEIMNFLKRKAGKKRYHHKNNYNPAVDDALRYADLTTVKQLLHKAESIIFMSLKENQ